jgi:hypothetical protein
MACRLGPAAAGHIWSAHAAAVLALTPLNKQGSRAGAAAWLLTLALLGGCCRWTVACATSNFGSEASAAAAAATLPCSESGQLRPQGVAQCRCHVDCLVADTCR